MDHRNITCLTTESDGRDFGDDQNFQKAALGFLRPAALSIHFLLVPCILDNLSPQGSNIRLTKKLFSILGTDKKLDTSRKNSMFFKI